MAAAGRRPCSSGKRRHGRRTMTSGQSGPYGEPGSPASGQPPQGWNRRRGWNPPPQQPPYGRAVPGLRRRRPSAPTGYGAPPPMERPTTVRAGIGAFVGRARARPRLARGHASPTSTPWSAGRSRAQPTRRVTEDVVRTGIVVGAVIGADLRRRCEVLFIWFAWKGHNWARIVLWVLGGLGVAVRPGRPGCRQHRQHRLPHVAGLVPAAARPRPASCCWR